MELYEKLLAIQSELKAPKGQFNKFGNFNYRSCENILEAVKPLMKKYGCTIIMSDEPVLIGDRFYVKAIATIIDVDNPSQRHTSTAYARESTSKSGFDSAQLTGSSSSYARKYALNGLLCIDDNKDSDTTDNSNNKQEWKPLVEEATTINELTKIWKKYQDCNEAAELQDAIKKKRDLINGKKS